MSTTADCEMLKWAAKAAGNIWLIKNANTGETYYGVCTGEGHFHGSTPQWNPLTDDGDALRLAEKLGMTLCMDGTGTVSAHSRNEFGIQDVFITQKIGKAGRLLATCLAITRAAAEIGRSKHE